jgi:cytochrome c oxidase subunit 2
MASQKVTRWIIVLSIIGVLVLVVPYMTLMLLANYATDSLKQYENGLNNNQNKSLQIRITAYKWYWQYEYYDSQNNPLGIQYATIANPELKAFVKKSQSGSGSTVQLKDKIKPLILPVDKQIQFLLKSNDVIHSFWVPRFGLKKDALPGIVNSAFVQPNKTGIYYGQCAEQCGLYHDYMPIRVKVVTQSQFDQWLTANKKSATKASTNK